MNNFIKAYDIVQELIESQLIGEISTETFNELVMIVEKQLDIQDQCDNNGAFK